MSNQAKLSLQCRLSETTVGTGEDHYMVIPCAGEWKLKAAYFCPSAATTGHASNTATLAVKQGSTAVVTAILIDDGSSGTNGCTAGTKLTFTVPASAGASLEFGQGDILHIDINKAASGVAVLGDFTFAFDQIVS